MTTYKVEPDPNCRYCHGTSTVTEYHPWGNTVAAEELICDCVLENVPEDYNEMTDDIDIAHDYYEGIIVRPSAEYES